eukprot:scaffold497306_cov28-Prasinocladus_malaysianus.AAC.1
MLVKNQTCSTPAPRVALSAYGTSTSGDYLRYEPLVFVLVRVCGCEACCRYAPRDFSGGSKGYGTVPVPYLRYGIRTAGTRSSKRGSLTWHAHRQ